MKIKLDENLSRYLKQILEVEKNKVRVRYPNTGEHPIFVKSQTVVNFCQLLIVNRTMVKNQQLTIDN